MPAQAALGGGAVQPSALLQAGGAVVDFAGRTAERERLRQWRDATGTLRVCLVHGPGGQGKTRLAMEVATEWGAQGWAVLRAFHRRDRQAPPAFNVPEGLGTAAGVLVVLDYAERWDTPDLLTLLDDTNVGAGRGIRVRVLLLARPSGVWWQSVAYRMEHDLGVHAERFELPPLESDPAVDRAGLFSAARDRFAELLDIPDTGPAGLPAGLADREEYQLVLAVHMAALVVVLAVHQGDEPPSDPVEVSAYLLARERHHWLSLCHRREDPLLVTANDMGQIVYTATLTGPLGYADGKRAVIRADIESSQSPGAMLKDHARCYPPAAQPGAAGTEPATVLEPLYPDRLGEDYVALLTPGHTHDHPADLWADEAPARLLAPADSTGPAAADEGPVWTRRALTTLVEAAARWPHLARTQLCPLLRTTPALAIQAGGAAVVALATHPHMDLDVLEAIDELLPEERREWAPAAAAVADRLLDHRLAAAADDAEERALIRGDLANRLANVGRHDRALALTEEAFMSLRELANREPSAARLPSLAYSVGNYAVRLAQVGRADDALTRSNEAVLWLSVLTAQNRDRFLPELARATHNHARWLTDAGREEEALSWSADAVEMLRELTVQPDGSLHVTSMRDLFCVVSAHARLLVNAGRDADALTYSGLALGALRDLVRLDRARFLPDLPAALSGHATLLEQTGRPLDALSHSEEAVEVQKELASLDGDPHLAALANALGSHAVLLSNLGRGAEALRVSEEAVHTCRESVHQDRDVHLAALIALVAMHMVLLERADRLAEAFVWSEEGVALCREKAGRDGDSSSLADLVRALIPHATRLMRMGRFDDALVCSQEAVAGSRELRGGPADTPGLPIAAGFHAQWLEEAGRLDDVLTYSAEAVEIARGRVQADRDANLPDLAATVGNHALRLADAGRWSDALEHCRESTAMFTELFERDPDAHRVGYVRNTVCLGHILIKAGRFTEAVIPLLFALGMAPQLKEHEHPIGAWITDLVRAAHAGAPQSVRRAYQEFTGHEMPAWFQRPPSE
ncbi:tetratricopeptide repeat protein [Streptomyces katrae]|uniref:tetratricopeptide repeat protein n=1 Tax=Streptomyces katrae TaxID=68223 RepID=UPI00131CB485|nr:tetratricopeptide repeat protein [Streptomyces katrae]